MKSVPRWLTSMTDMPLPFQSSSSACARRRTGSGSIAGPGLKLNTRFMAGVRTVFGRILFARHGLDARDADEAIVLVEANQPDALGVASHRGNVRERRAHERAGRRYQHQLVFGRDLQRAHDAAVALRRLNTDDALTPAALHRVLLERRELAVAVRGGRHDRPRADDDERDELVSRTGQLQPAHARGVATHRSHVAFGETDGLARAGEQHDFLLAVRDPGADQSVVVAQL